MQLRFEHRAVENRVILGRLASVSGYRCVFFGPFDAERAQEASGAANPAAFQCRSLEADSLTDASHEPEVSCGVAGDGLEELSAGRHPVATSDW